MNTNTREQLEAIVNYVQNDVHPFKIMNDLEHYTDRREYLKDNVEVWEMRRRDHGVSGRFYFHLHRMVRRMLKTDKELEDLLTDLKELTK